MSSQNPALRYRKVWLITGYALVALVVYLSVTSTPPDIGPEIPFKDKFYHALAYFTLMAWFAQIYHIKIQRILWALLFVCMGVGLEYVQSFDPAREGGIADAIANTVGVLIGFVLARTALANIFFKIERLL